MCGKASPYRIVFSKKESLREAQPRGDQKGKQARKAEGFPHIRRQSRYHLP